jgi:hypothetical protein
MFEMKSLKIAHLVYIVIFHLKMIFCQNFNLPHINGHYHLENTHSWYDNYQNLHMTPKLISIIWNHNV